MQTQFDDNSTGREINRLKQQVRELDASLKSKREESRLEIKMDMLLAGGEVLQYVYTIPDEQLRKNIIGGLENNANSRGSYYN